MSADWIGTTLTINGDAANNSIVVNVGSGVVTVNNGAVPINPSAPAPGIVQKIVVNGNDGVDTLDLTNVATAKGFLAAYLNNPSTPTKDVQINGGQGQDVIVGSAFDDAIDGGSQDDDIEGRDGDDDLFGGTGDDTIDGNEGDDFVDGLSGQDTIHGDNGNDDLNGDDGDDDIYGDAGDDVLHGNDADDELYGGAGNDRLEGGEDNAVCQVGGLGCDATQVQDIANWVDGDTLVGGTGDDNYEFDYDGGQYQGLDRITEAASAGVDALDFTEWNQFIKVSLANVALHFEVQNVTWLGGMGGIDKLFLYLNTPAQFENIYADADPLHTNLNVDGTLGGNYDQGMGMTGNVITGNAADNLLVGGPYSETIVGGDGNDIIEGRDNVDLSAALKPTFDTLDGGNGNDVINGGAGDDVITAGIGVDYVNGDGYGDVQKSTLNLLDPTGVKLGEASGLIVGRNSPGILWSINDGKVNQPRNELFANLPDGNSRGYYVLKNSGGTALSNVDWEDLGFYDTGGTKYLYVADIGDNDLNRSSVTIYRFAEPTLTGTSTGNRGDITVTESVVLTYPSGTARDAESFFVDPLNGDLYIVSKNEPTSGSARLYRKTVPASWTGGSFALSDLGTVRFPEGTSNDSPSAADISPNGLEVLIKSDNTIHHYRRVSTATSLDTLLTDGATPAQVVMVREENNREAIAFDPADGTTFYTVSEKTGPDNALVAQKVFKYQLATGDDSVEGGAGNDTLRGGNGVDYLSGDADNDTLYGDADWDAMMGGTGNDTFTGGDGTDFWAGDTGTDTNPSPDVIELGGTNVTTLQAFPVDLTAGSDSGISTTDDITNDTTPTFNGKAAGRTYVRLFRSGTLVATKTIDSFGDFTITPTSAEPNGTFNYTITVAVDSSAAQSTASPALSVTIDTAGPKVSNLTIGAAVHADYAFGPSNVGTGALQLKTVPVGGANEVIVTFDTSVVASTGDLILKGKALGGSVTTYAYSGISPASGAATSFTWTTTATMATGQKFLELLSGASDVRDVAGNLLDGEWTNPTSLSSPTSTDTFPSGNGTAGGNFTFSFTILVGDADRNNIIDLGDLNAVRNNFGTGTTWAEGDTDGDGDVDLTDLNQVRNQFGDNITTAWDGSESLMMGQGGGGDSLLDFRDALFKLYGDFGIDEEDSFWTEEGTDEWWEELWKAIGIG